MTETVAAIHTLGMMQAVELRGLRECGLPIQELHAFIREKVPFHDADRAMDRDIAWVKMSQRSGSLPLPELPSNYTEL